MLGAIDLEKAGEEQMSDEGKATIVLNRVIERQDRIFAQVEEASDDSKRLRFLADPQNADVVDELVAELYETNYHAWCKAIDAAIVDSQNRQDDEWEEWDDSEIDDTEHDAIMSGVVRAFVFGAIGLCYSPWLGYVLCQLAILYTAFEYLHSLRND